ncbi:MULTISPECIES: methylenetetrahydrofolate reductase [NAD(P)H] [Nitrosomonas]|uniref:Methylenetetrahydrofolate reductase n=2 Tax=Nitrosomonas eutropha TaxID=916 RepID=A0ABX5M8G8_9PROT|nr:MULTISPECIES: methylenetetrahydrofolate reductase [NAD(P)H] [Nitrosomonas]ABI60123.1 5,10-methylenetetrahydrofolate reductase [Nitrosomonas eutropha C91]MXS80880.1 methylenetetrahydrofolate reductase [NAD(P)H] [Nitrosomonas sp. GH22]PXV77545.1 5,10-methylenetetrahydrofolate reductase (NAD(P)) [Nitrosomonas eutropha]SCX15324.1 5,10-methylenetetrahydrofolate reductase (NAD(P)) [Nitrosomonas eutropha]SDW68396.1 5,10-methylenetetrahydrofolate reductase (NAD(P)) [Nitrosomonas eutropha]
MLSQKNFTPTFSFEFFPPQTPEGMEKLRATRIQLARFNPKFFSVTFGAGGSTRERTLETVLEIQAEGSPVAPHLSCIGSTRDNIRSILEKYHSHNIRHIIALRGDLPSGMAQAGEFRYANELVAFIRKEFGDTFWIEVAAYPEYHPQARSALEDFTNFRRKVEAGANAAITQFFYNVDAYLHFVEMCEAANISVPIVPGIMPISKFSQLARFSDGCGAEIPRWIRKKLESFGDDIPSIQAFGLDVVTALCARLLEAGAPGLHFYTLNSAVLPTKIWQRLGLTGH